MTYTPRLRRPRLASTYGLNHLVRTQTLMQYAPYFQDEIDPDKPRRKSMVAPVDKNTFVRPIKQSFVKNPRTMAMTRIMLTLLAGWAGQGGALETTTGIIGKHISRSRRQVFRYLQDAMEEGYLYYSRTKDRIGRYTGIRIFLNFAAIRHSKTGKKPKKYPKAAENLDVTLKSDTKQTYILNKDIEPNKDQELWDKLASLATTAGFLEEYRKPN